MRFSVRVSALLLLVLLTNSRAHSLDFATLSATARAKYASGDVAEAESLWRQAYEIAIEEFGETVAFATPAFAATALNGWGVALLDVLPVDAFEKIQRALVLRRSALGDSHADVGWSWNNVALANERLGEYGEALAAYDAALRIHERAERPDTIVAVVLRNRAACFVNIGRLGDAAVDIENATARLARAGEDTGLLMAGLLDLLAFVESENYGPRAAISRQREALAIRRRILGEDHPVVAASWNNLGRALYEAGDLREAHAAFRTALELLERRNVEYGVTARTVLANIGAVAMERGDYVTALAHWERLYDQLVGVHGGDESRLAQADVAAVLTDLGRAHEMMGRPLEALARYEEAIGVTELLLGETHPNLAALHHNVATVFDALGDTASASASLARAWSLTRGSGSLLEASVVSAIGASSLREGDSPAALAYFLEAASQRRRLLGDRHPDVAIALNNAGLTLAKQGRPGEAIARYDEALEVLRDRVAPSGASPWLASRVTVQVLWNLAVARAAENSDSGLRASLEAADAALQVLQRLRAAISRESRGYHEDNFADLPAYVLMLRKALEETGEPQPIDLIIEAAEMQSAWAFLEMLGSSRADLSSAAPSGVRDAANDLEAGLASLAQGELADGERVELEEEIDRLTALIEAEAPDYIALRFPRPATAVEARRVLGDDEIALSYVSSSDSWYLVGLSNDSDIFVDLGSGERIRKAIRRFLSAVKDPSAVLDTYLTELHGLLVRPAERFVNRKKIVVIPSGEAERVPFAALADSAGRRLGQGHVITYAPSLSILALLRSKLRETNDAPRRLLTVADPLYLPGASDGIEWQRLPGTASEAVAVGSLFENDSPLLLTGNRAREADILALDWNEFDFLHFATHGHWRADGLVEPALVLATETDPNERDGYLTLSEIAAKPHRSRLTVLSACNSGLAAADRPGSGVSSIARAFLLSGSDAVVVSLWEVSDAATAELMTDAYARMRLRDAEPAEAFAAAQKRLERSALFADPRYWAPFIVVGR